MSSNRTPPVSRRTTLAMLSSTAALAACGGGGSQTPTPTPTPTPSPTPTSTGTPPPPAPVWSGFAHDAQHTGVGNLTSQDLGRITWSSPVDLAPQYTSSGALLTHYGSPAVTDANTIVIPVKTTATGGFRVEGRSGATGTQIWSLASDYTTPPHNWLPSYNVLITP